MSPQVMAGSELKIFCVSVCLVGLLAGCRRKPPPTVVKAKGAALRPLVVAQPPRGLSWGRSTPQGLQMAAWADPKLPVVWCSIRNDSPEAVRYCDYELGYFGSVGLLGRPEGGVKWRPIPRRQRARYVLSAGPLPGAFRKLAPGDVMPPSSRDSGLAGAAGPARTLMVDLGDFDWPPSWRGRVELRITQTLSGFAEKDVWSGSVQSETLVLGGGRVTGRASRPRPTRFSSARASGVR